MPQYERICFESQDNCQETVDTTSSLKSMVLKIQGPISKLYKGLGYLRYEITLHTRLNILHSILHYAILFCLYSVFSRHQVRIRYALCPLPAYSCDGPSNSTQNTITAGMDRGSVILYLRMHVYKGNIINRGRVP